MINTINTNFFIDGNFAFHIHKYLVEKFGQRINWKAFLTYLQSKVSEIAKANGDNISSKSVRISAKYFVGTATYSNEREREVFYSSLDHAGIVKKAFQLRTDSELGVKEEGVDVSLAVEAISDYFEVRDKDRYSYFILFSGDSDFVPLIEKLKSFAIKPILVYMDFDYNGKVTKAGVNLLKSVDSRVNLQHLFDDAFIEDSKKAIFEEYCLESKIQCPVQKNIVDERSLISWTIIEKCMDDCVHLPQGNVRLAELGSKLKQKVNFTGSIKQILMTSFSDKLIFDYGEKNEDVVRYTPAYFCQKKTYK